MHRMRLYRYQYPTSGSWRPIYRLQTSSLWLFICICISDATASTEMGRLGSEHRYLLCIIHVSNSNRVRSYLIVFPEVSLWPWQWQWCCPLQKDHEHWSVQFPLSIRLQISYTILGVMMPTPPAWRLASSLTCLEKLFHPRFQVSEIIGTSILPSFRKKWLITCRTFTWWSGVMISSSRRRWYGFIGWKDMGNMWTMSKLMAT